MPAYPVPAPAGEWIISDDTQMTLALHDALVDVEDFADIEAVTDAIVRHFVLWQVDPDNTRAPGRACMGSLHRLRSGARWYDKDGARESAGCGAVMRLVPAAFVPSRTGSAPDRAPGIASVIAGTSGLDKTDFGTLILSGTNTYTGGTTVSSGVLQVSRDASLGAWPQDHAERPQEQYKL